MAHVKHTVAATQLHRMLLGAIHQGLDVEAILRRAGIAQALLESPTARITQAQCAALIRVLIRSMRDEFWGLCDRPVRIGTFAEACRIMVERRTLGEALRAGLRYYHLMLDDWVGRLCVVDGVATVTLVERAPWDQRHGYAQSTFLFCGTGLLSWLVARRITPREVHLRNEKAAFNTDTGGLFGAEVLYAQPRPALSFDARWLEQPVVQNAQTLEAFLQEAPACLLVRYRDKSSATERTRRLLRRHLNRRILTLEDVSDMLAMTPQTLRRRLQEEGQGFQAIKDDLRRDMSIAYLAEPHRTLLEVAELVGFSETSTFHRAFKGWTGVAPGEYRQRRLHVER